uniref:Uncharacterized protein n=1 Tax=Attheya septentrionalis TaxID=420275 RepID=A0A7S2XTM1_9STRA|mmetsp:Transcript_28108/g.51197  ORF Transcript_28108/g.51197 Transcript_28108/m.51197 type:complete len:105 (+) Transcript_28108:271-585(+)
MVAIATKISNRAHQGRTLTSPWGQGPSLDLDLATLQSARHVYRRPEFEEHRKAMEEATTPQGCTRDDERYQTWLPETLGSYWWLEEKVPESFSLAALDMTYDKK